MTQLCVAIFVPPVAPDRSNEREVHDRVQRDVAIAVEQGADFVELRLDHQTFESSVADGGGAPTIVTCRPSWEGGYSELPEGQRVALLREMPGAYADIELETVRRLGDEFVAGSKRLIFSSHDFAGRPDRLINIVNALYASRAHVAKIVWTARTIRDNLEAFEILQQRQKATIALCMGEAGLISRVLAKKFGAFLTFASLDAGSETAPGQVSIRDMKRLYRWDAQTANTKVYGVVGSPVAHSMSPAIHNAAFEQVGHDGVYVPLLVNEGYESFKAFIETFLAFNPLHLSGLSVTIPHKENALRYMKEKGYGIAPAVERIGALNTIVVERYDKDDDHDLAGSYYLHGFSTDYPAILDSITSALSITREDLKDYRVAVLGAGGTGRTAVAALANFGATVVVYNRTLERAQALADEFNGKTGKVVAARLDKLCDSCCQIYLNTSSVGMHPNVDASPFGETPLKLSPDTLVFDTVYNPIQTRLLQQAEAAGARTINGVEMFVRQAAAQFEAWTGKPAPVEVMRAVVAARLAR